MSKLFITQQSHDIISDALGVNRTLIESYEIIVNDEFIRDYPRYNQQGSNNHHYGHKHSAETKKNISEKNKNCKIRLGAKLSEESKDKIRQKAIGRKGSEKQREWIIQYNKNRALKKLNQAPSLS
jgi:hypothetical protein